MEKIEEQKNLKKQGTTLTDHQIIKGGVNVAFEKREYVELRNIVVK